MNRLIYEEMSRITDEELFRSPAFAAYLTDIAETATERYRKGIRVKTLYDPSPSAMLACTDNRKITINTGNYITQSFPTRSLKADSLVGLNAHEIGHILYTNFKVAEYYFASLQKEKKDTLIVVLLLENIKNLWIQKRFCLDNA